MLFTDYSTVASNADATITSTIILAPCEHKNGWWQNIPWWGFFRKHVFCCEDCWRIIDAKTKRDLVWK